MCQKVILYENRQLMMYLYDVRVRSGYFSRFCELNQLVSIHTMLMLCLIHKEGSPGAFGLKVLVSPASLSALFGIGG